MATRAVIKVEGITFCQVYKHYDGDPESTLPWLEYFNEEFTKDRGEDSEYKTAQLLRSSSFLGEIYGLDDSQTTGWGVIPYNSDYNQEYEYELMKDGTVKYKSV